MVVQTLRPMAFEGNILSDTTEDREERCFICGESRATWVLHSKPNNKNKPFFPFLQYQKTPLHARGLDISGRCLSCNVCYLFLTQQWDAYEANRTPILKRLYWLKRPAEEYTDLDDTKSEKSSLIAIGNAAACRDNRQQFGSYSHHQSSSLYESETSGQQNKFDTSHVKKTDVNAGTQRDSVACQLCNLTDISDNAKLVFTTLQHPGIPFYTGLVSDTSTLNEDGKILLCQVCYITVHRQWLEYERNSISYSERVYGMNVQLREKTVTVACFLCNDILSHDRRQALFCKQQEAGAYYPFLKNLPTTYNAKEINEDGFTYCCEKCEAFLRKQWDVFEDANVNQEERVYRVHYSQPPLLPTSITFDDEIVCLICSKSKIASSMKRIYCNPGSNMNLGFLKSFSRTKDGFFNEETGETLVCTICFAELRQHWMRYRNTLFGSNNKIKLLTKFQSCEICNVSSSEIMTKLQISSEASEDDDSKPYFPCLAVYCKRDKCEVLACQICSLNLFNQWSFNKSNEGKMSVIYEPEKFVCCCCNKTIDRKYITLVNSKILLNGDAVKANHQGVKIGDQVVICEQCREEETVKRDQSVSEEDSKNSETENKKDKKEDIQEESGMKATATVPPFLNFSMRNQDSIGGGSSSGEGSFAAALRKLAQQAPGYPSSILPRASRPTSPTRKNGDIASPLSMHHSAQSSTRISGTPSIMVPSHSIYPRADKQDPLLKSPYGRTHPDLSKDNILHRDRGPMIPGLFQYQERDEHLHRQSKEHDNHPREHEQGRRSSTVSTTGVILKNSSFKERPSSSIGLVHPQPVRKHQDEDNIKTSAMNSIHYNHREPSIRPVSPTELHRYAPFVTPRQHQHTHGSTSSCPVHGHEVGHDERSARPPPLPFDPAHVPRDFAMHAQHPRLREELQLLQQHGRHAGHERKEIVQSHHAFEEDLRRRGMDYRYGFPPHLLDEQYRRHLLNAGHEHSPSFKEPPHGLYLPHFHFGREYPVPIDQYLPHGIPGQADMLHRHGPPISPRLLEHYRRTEHERSRSEYEAERRHEERREKERIHHTSSVELIKRKNSEEFNHVDRKKSSHQVDEKNNNQPPTSNGITKVPFFRGLDYKSKPTKSYENARQANSIDSLLSTKLPDPKTELAAASILANMNRINQSPCSDELESLTSSSGAENHFPKPIQPKIEESDMEENEQPDEKLNYMMTLGLVSHTRKRVLEDDYERQRWERKFRKYRGRPKKRSKRENTEESSLNGDSRSISDLDFYSGPMTRHKQQLLQEQETLLEQIQKRHSTDSNQDESASVNQTESISPELKPKARRSLQNSPNKSKSIDESTETIKPRLQLNNLSSPPSSSGIMNHYISNRKMNLAPVNTNHRIRSPESSGTRHSEASVTRPPETSSHDLEQSRLVAMLRDNNSRDYRKSMHDVQYERPHHDTKYERPHLHPHHSRPPLHMDHIENIKALDNSLFGRLVENNPKTYAHWPGIQPIAHAYSAYHAEYETKRKQLMQSFDGLQREGHNLHQKREFLEKDMNVYNERRMRITEKRRNMHLAMEGIQQNIQNIRTMSNL